MAINMQMEGVDVGDETPGTLNSNNQNSNDGPQSTSSSAGPSYTSSKREETDDAEGIIKIGFFYCADITLMIGRSRKINT